MTTGVVTAMCGPEDLRLKEFDVPDPGPGSVLLKIRRANVCGSDLHIFHYESPALRQARPAGIRLPKWPNRTATERSLYSKFG